MIINLLDKDNKISFKLKGFKSLIRVYFTLAICVVVAMIVNVPSCSRHVDGKIYASDISKNTHNDFYSYGKYVNYDDYDLTKPKYCLFTSEEDLELNTATKISDFGEYESEKLFFSQKNKVKTRNKVNTPLTTQNKYYFTKIGSYLILSFFAYMFICGALLMIKSNDDD